jgi:hypothetical protein
VSSSESPTPGPRAAPGQPAAARIAERVAALDAVGDLPLAEHAEAYQRLHTELQAALAEIDGS